MFLLKYTFEGVSQVEAAGMRGDCINSPVVCAVLALNGWNYYSGKQDLTV